MSDPASSQAPNPQSPADSSWIEEAVATIETAVSSVVNDIGTVISSLESGIENVVGDVTEDILTALFRLLPPSHAGVNDTNSGSPGAIDPYQRWLSAIPTINGANPDEISSNAQAIRAALGNYIAPDKAPDLSGTDVLMFARLALLNNETRFGIFAIYTGNDFGAVMRKQDGSMLLVMIQAVLPYLVDGDHFTGMIDPSTGKILNGDLFDNVFVPWLAALDNQVYGISWTSPIAGHGVPEILSKLPPIDPEYDPVSGTCENKLPPSWGGSNDNNPASPGAKAPEQRMLCSIADLNGDTPLEKQWNGIKMVVGLLKYQQMSLANAGILFFTRFVFIDNFTRFAVLTVYTSDFEDYIMDFGQTTVLAMFQSTLPFVVGGGAFDGMVNADEGTIADYGKYLGFVKWLQHIDDQVHGLYWWSAFPGYQIDDLLAVLPQPATGAAVAAVPAKRQIGPDARVEPGDTSAPLDLDDIQGFLVRGYSHHNYARHFVLQVADQTKAKAWLATLVDPTNPLRITTAGTWAATPAATVNIGMTYQGLVALGYSGVDPAGILSSFKAGAANQSNNYPSLGDTGSSAPNNWVAGMGLDTNVHMILSLWVLDPTTLDQYSAQLTTAPAFVGAVTVIHSQDATALPDETVHFGYKDSISQPNIQGYPNIDDDGQTLVRSSFFIMDNDDYGPFTLPSPNELWKNGGMGAFRILEQDTAGFAKFVNDQAAAHGVMPNMIAAKFCGRWADGTPLALSPDTYGTDTGVGPNQFDYTNDTYITSTGMPSTTPYSDSDGNHCPFGSHMRRTNGRLAPREGGDPVNNRVLRRAMPYGPAFDPANPDDGIERGLIGYFFGASIEKQYEFIMGSWVNSAGFEGIAKWNDATGKAHGAVEPIGRDPILGANDNGTTFLAPVDGREPLVISGIPRFVFTKGGAYCFLPSVTGIKYLANN